MRCASMECCGSVEMLGQDSGENVDADSTSTSPRRQPKRQDFLRSSFDLPFLDLILQGDIPGDFSGPRQKFPLLPSPCASSLGQSVTKAWSRSSCPLHSCRSTHESGPRLLDAPAPL